jgi:hypothetical protein
MELIKMKYYTFFNTDELNVIGEYSQIEKSEKYNLSSPRSRTNPFVWFAG